MGGREGWWVEGWDGVWLGGYFSCRGIVQELFKGGGGVALNVIFQKGSFCTDLFPNTFHF